jgi:hypothetical protein
MKDDTSFDLYMHDDVVQYNGFFYMCINVFQIPEKTYFKWLGFRVQPWQRLGFRACHVVNL